MCPTLKLCNIDYSIPKSELISQLCTKNPILTDEQEHIKLLFSIDKKYYAMQC